MGLELVEFVMKVEDVFDISITDTEAQGVRTPRELKDFVFQRIQHADTAACLSQRGFYRLRGALSTGFDGRVTRVRPKIQWDEIFPLRKSRRPSWGALQSSVGISLPQLVRPRWLVVSGFVFSFLLAGAAFLLWRGPLARGLALSLVLCMLVGVCFAALTRSFRRSLAPRYASVGAVATYIAVTAPTHLKGLREGWTRRDVSDVIDGLIVETFGVDDFGDDSHFVRDMRIA